MQIEAGKRYVRRDGSVSGSIVCNNDPTYWFVDPDNKKSFTKGGSRYTWTTDSSDLVAEYVEPVSPSEVSGKESTVEYDLSGIPAGYEFVGYRLVKEGDQYLGNVGGTKVFVATASDVTFKKKRIIVKPITPPEPVQRTVVLHRWLVWDEAGKERMFTATESCVRSLSFKNVVDLGLYEEVKVNV